VPAGSPAYEVVIVDNDALGSAGPVVAQAAGSQPAAAKWAAGATHGSVPGAAGPVPVRLVREPEANIAVARNRGVREASADLIAFIDDDFVVPPTWLGEVLQAMADPRTDVLLGDVRPFFEAAGGPSDRPAPGVAAAYTRAAPTKAGVVPVRADGYVAGARSGNAVLRRRCFAGAPPWFDPAFGRSGGEDSDFFMRLGRCRPRIIRSAEAFVQDFVPQERQSAAYLIARAAREGRNYARLVVKNSRRPVLRAIDLAGRGTAQAAGLSLWLLAGRLLPPERRLALAIRRGLALGKARLAGAAGDAPYR
jgi:succinoglycan biosynthesis protein ExoM